MPMRYAPSLALSALLLAAPAAAQQPRFEVPAFEGRWYRGNTHAHTTESDGDSPPEMVARWYKEHGYQFLVLSDHNVFTDSRALAYLVDSTFLLIPGEEVTASFQRAPVHVNGLNLPGLVAPRSAETLLATVQANVDAVREVDGMPHINHPNFRWAIPADVLAQVRNDRLLEIFNGQPLVHNTGVELRDIVVTPTRLEVHIAVRGDYRYTTTFIGEGGRVLATSIANPAVFELTSATRYVRARVVDSGGAIAWVQPVFVAGR